LRELGVTALELMPVAQFPGGRNWGYDGVHPYAAQSTYGGPAGLKRLVDAAHGEGLAVLLDVVYNHLGPEGNYLAEFGPYFTDRYRTPWGQAVNFDGPDSDEVRRYFVDNALYWITECHLDGLRLDAVHAIFDFGARHFLAELADAVHAQAALLKRRVHVIAESDLNDPRLVRTSDRGGYGLDGQWNEDFHHAVHAALTGERQAYYCDFGGVDQVAAVLERNFTLDGRYSAHRRRRHGMPAADVPPHRFVVFLQNHDQVGNRARGDRFAEIVPLPARRLGAALTLLAPSVPLLFMGEEYGETRPFLYFTSHADQALVEAVRQGRREEFAAFGWTEQPPDPQSEATFRRSRLSWDVEDDPARRHLGRLYRDLLAVRRAEPTLRAAEVQRHVLHGPPGWIAVRMESGGRAALLAVFNLADVETTLGAAPPGQWRLRLSTEAEAYGGAGTECPATLHGDAGDGLTLAPHSAALFRQEVT
jgi:maltooligosyltrehalose trehalohydrolase